MDQPDRIPELESLFPEVDGVVVYQSSLLRDVDPHPLEAPFIENAIENRKAEFVTGRACARAAIEALGFEAQALPVGHGRQPQWPEGVTASITHTRRRGQEFIAAAAARTDQEHGPIAIGLDAEIIQPLKDGVREKLLTIDETHIVDQLPPEDRELAAIRVFSAKEAFYKAQYAFTEGWVGFGDMRLEGLESGGPFELHQTGDLEVLQGLGLPVECHQVVLDDLVVSGVTLRRV